MLILPGNFDLVMRPFKCLRQRDSSMTAYQNFMILFHIKIYSKCFYWKKRIYL